jgi:N-acetylmuramoyl-L-alanine amidase
MCASPTKAETGLTREATPAAGSVSTSPLGTPLSPEPNPVRGDALQALLAFSSLHQHIRQRCTVERNGSENVGPSDPWQTEQYVLDEVLQLVAQRALAVTGVDGVAIALAQDGEVICRGSAGSMAPDAGARLDPRSSFSGTCLRYGEVVRCDDVEVDERVNLQACRRLGTRSMVAVPLCGRHTVVGLLQAFSADAYAFNDSDVRSLKLLAELVVAALKPEEEIQLSLAARAAIAEPQGGPFTIHISGNQEAAPASDTGPQETREPHTPEPPLFSELEPTPPSRPGLTVVMAVVMIAALLAAGLWWKMQKNSRTTVTIAPPAETQSVVATPPATDSSPAGAQPSESSRMPAAETATTPPAAAAEEIKETRADSPLSVLPRVTGIRHWSSANASTVVIDLQDQVQYEAHRLSSPDRIYFDLHDTVLPPGLYGKTIEIGDALLTRVRVAQPVAGVTRVVLETNGGSNFSVSLEPNPYRLVVELRSVQSGGSDQPRAKIDLFPPAAADSEVNKMAASPLDREDVQLRSHVPKLRIVLDPGHGGWDLGTVGHKGLLEKDLVLDVAARLGDLLASRLRTEVIYTRKDDTYIALEQRAEIANQTQADLFVSIHANYSDLASARGVETYYTNFFSPPGSREIEKRENGTLSQAPASPALSEIELRDKVQESRRLAVTVQRALYGTLVERSPSIRNRGVKEAAFLVLTGTAMPSILAEISFVSSPTDEQNLQSAAYRQRIAQALYKGIARYAASSHRVKMASASARQTGE